MLTRCCHHLSTANTYQVIQLSTANVIISRQSIRSCSTPGWGRILQLGMPRSGPLLLRHPGHIIGYDPMLKVARWACEVLTSDRKYDDITGSKARRKVARFQPDPLLPAAVAVYPEDYRGSGLQRGHLAAAANHLASQLAFNHTFYMSNIVPQPGCVNGGVWRHLEAHGRRLAERRGPVWLTSGPLFVAEQRADGSRALVIPLLGTAGVPVPSHLFKTLVYRGERGRLSAQTFVVRNGPDQDEEALERCLVTLEEAERLSGLRLLGRIPRHQLTQLRQLSLC